MFCSISGEPTVDPVVSPRSGAIFERKHIVNYISTSGTDPIDNLPLSVDELILVKAESTIVPPRLVTGTSIPSLLSTFQNEWDSLALEVFTLRKQLFIAREELSSALYHQDAAVRVAANAIKERDEAREALKELAFSLAKPEEPKVGIPVELINAARTELFQLHKSIKSVYSVKPDQGISLEVSSEVAIDVREISSVHYNNTIQQYILGTSTGEVVDILHDYKFNIVGEVTSVNVVNNHVLASTSDYIKVFKNGEISEVSQQKLTTQLVVHPSLDLFISISPKNWAINSTDQSLFTGESQYGLLSSDIHVDGAFFGLGTDSKEVQLYDLPTGDFISKIETAHQNVTQLLFSLNGYWLFAASNDNDGSTIEVIDLRKNNVAYTLNFDGVTKFTVDPSSSVLVTYTNDKLSLHRFIKKTKKWLENLATVNVGKVQDIHILQAHDDTDYINDNRLEIGVLYDTRLVKYEVNAHV